MKLCEECQREFKHARGFNSHLKYDHRMSLRDYVVKYVHSGVAPVCACGCGQTTKWRANNSCFMKLVYGHVTNKMREMQADRRRGAKSSIETKGVQ